MKTEGEKITRTLTKDELIQQLLSIPGNPLVMIERGEWGPSRADRAQIATVHDHKRDNENWEVFDLAVEDDEDDPPRLEVILIS